MVDEWARLGHGSKSDSRSERSEGEGSWSSFVHDADDVFGTWASGAPPGTVEVAQRDCVKLC